MDSQANDVLKAQLERLKERELEKLDDEKRRSEDRYNSIEQKVVKVATMLGIDPDRLVVICAQASVLYDMPWYHMLDYVQAFYVTKKRLEKEGKVQ